MTVETDDGNKDDLQAAPVQPPAAPVALAPGADEALSIDARDVTAEDGPPDLDERTGVPKVLRAYVVHKDPKITIVPNFLSDAEIGHLLELAEDCWVPSVVGTGIYKTNNEAKDLTNKTSSNRTSYSCMLKSAQTPSVESVEHRLAHLVGMEVEYLERLNLVRYAPGQFFNKHHDGRFRPKTVFIYLNDLPDGDGGETYFPELGVKFVPRKGCAVMWSNILSPSIDDPRTVHQGLPPRTTMKYGVNCFFNDKPLKQWEDVDSDLDDDTDLVVAKNQNSSRWRTIDAQSLVQESAPSKPLLPGQLRSFTICQEPRLSVLPDFLSPDEAALLISCAEPEDARQAQASPEALARIEQRMAVVAGTPLAHMDPLRVARCEPKMTPDGQVLAGGQYGKRFGRKVVYIFLNDVSEGGELRFPRLNLQVRPSVGCAVVWQVAPEGAEEDPRAAHQGRPPKVGIRYNAIGVFRDGPVRTA